VLIVDDQPANLLYLQRLLELWGMKVSGAIDGMAALEVLKERRFDLVIADEYIRNRTSGLTEFAQDLQLCWPTDGIPLVVTSSGGAAQTIGSGVVQGVVLKPIQRKSLRAAIVRVLSKLDALPRSTCTTRPLDSRRILVAEDNLINQRVAIKMLSRLGQDATVVANGQEAVNAVAAGEFDLVFMDVNMPVQNGIEATRQIRRRFGSQPMIVAMTADILPENLRCCRDAGMDDVIVKPISMQELVRVIERVSPAPGVVDREMRR